MMNIKQSKLTKPNTQLAEAEAFFRGAQGVSNEDGLAETRADFETLKAVAERDAAGKIKALKAEIEISREGLTEAEARRTLWNEITENIAPHFFKYVGLVLAGFLMLFGETALLQRVTDVFGVAEPLFQFILVGVIGLLLATLADSVVWFWKNGYNRAVVCVYGAAVML